MSKIVLNDIYPDWLNGKGILKNLTDNFDVPWKDSVEGDILDLEYHGNRSGNKIIAPLMENLIDENGISDANMLKVSKLLYTRYSVKWGELWRSLSLYSEFDPLDNVNEITDNTITRVGSDFRKDIAGTQQITDSIGEQTNINRTGAQSSSNTVGANSVTNNYGAEKDSTENGMSAFNSGNYSNNTKTTNNKDAKTDTINNSARQDSQNIGAREDEQTIGAQTNTKTLGEQQNTSDGTFENTEVISIRRHGNIGVTTSGQLINDFRAVVSWEFFEEVFKDIDYIIVTGMFGCKHSSIDGLVIINKHGIVSINGIEGTDITLTASDVGAASISDLEDVQQSISTINNSLSTLNNTVNTLSTNVNNISERLEPVESDIVSMNSRLNNIEQDLTNVTTLINDFITNFPYVKSVNGETGDVIVKGGSASSTIKLDSTNISKTIAPISITFEEV